MVEMRRLWAVIVLMLLAFPAGLFAQDHPPSQRAMAVSDQADRDAFARGYLPPRGPDAMIPALVGSSGIRAPLGSLFTEALVHPRACSEAEAGRYHPCIKLDALAVYVADSSAGDRLIVGVIPRTFVGDSANDAVETEPSPEVLADAAIIARRYEGTVVRPGPDTGSGPVGARPGQLIREPNSSEALGRAQIEATRQGYQMGGSAWRMLRPFAALGPSPAVTGFSGLGLMAARRDCTTAEVASHHPCLRVDWLEIFFGPEVGGTNPRIGVIPHTAVGTKAQDLAEVEADSTVVISAGVVAEKSGGRVVHAIPWQIPVTPPPAH